MGWWKTRYGTMGDDPADLVGTALEKIPKDTTAAALVSALAEVIASTPKLFADEEERTCWSVRGVVAGKQLEPIAPPEALVVRVRRIAKQVAQSFKTGVGRIPSPPELVDAFAFVLRKSSYAVEVDTVVDEAGLRRADLMFRRKIALDPNTPNALLVTLSVDGSEIVRAAALSRLRTGPMRS